MSDPENDPEDAELNDDPHGLVDGVVTECAHFPRKAVAALLSFAARNSQVDVVLVKDDGAYLMTYDKRGRPHQETLVYAVGHNPPPRPTGDQPPSLSDPNDPWLVQRAHTERVWGGDDFVETFTIEEVQEVLGSGGLLVETELDNIPVERWSQHMPDLSGRGDPIRHLRSLTLKAWQAPSNPGGAAS